MILLKNAKILTMAERDLEKGDILMLSLIHIWGCICGKGRGPHRYPEKYRFFSG